MTEKHPFLSDRYEVAWSSLDVQRLQNDIEHALELAESRVRHIEQLSTEQVSYESVAHALEGCSEELDRAWSIVEHLNNVMDAPDLRKAYGEVLPKVTAFYSGICLREKLWTVVRQLAKNQTELTRLDPVRRRHVEELLKDFQECGADLPEAERKRIAEIDHELATLTQKFSENVLDATNDWEMIIEDAAVLSEMPDVLREIARENALRKGHGTEAQPKWRFTLHAPSWGPFMKFVNDAALRKAAWQAANAVGRTDPWSNGGLIAKILSLRHEKATLLGFANFADHILQRRMAKNGTNARAFVQRMREAVTRTVPGEVKELEQFRAQQLGLDNPEPLEPWDVAFWSEKLLKAHYAFDEESLRPFFPINQVISGLFELVERVFGLRVVERAVKVGSEGPADAVEVWTESVQFYEIFDTDSGHKLGAFYADWFPRESKRSGAWMDTLRSGCFGENGEPNELPLGIMCGNMTPGSRGKAALLTHDEVETVFHEFGHLLHELCGEVHVKSLNGISVPWDFVEVPSQIMENWCWQRESLNLFARHHETGEGIPEDLFESMCKTRNFQKGLFILRQLSFGIMDLDLHIDFASDPELGEDDLDAFVKRSTEQYRPAWKSPSIPLLHRFGHLFSGAVAYAAGYYSYQWSEVIEADAFSRFLETGVLNPETGRAFRREILAAGNRREPMESYVAFRGRKPTLEAYLARSGMEATPESAEAFGA